MIQFLISKIIWYRVGKEYGKNIQSTIHAIVSSLLGLLGIYTRNYTLFNSLINYTSTGYFITDCFNETNGNDIILHHLVGIYALNYVTEYYPMHPIICQSILVELSTPFLNEFRRTRRTVYGYGLLISFALLRLFYFPYVYIFETKKQLNPPTYINVVVYMFILLNYYWFYKICKIAYNIKHFRN